LKAVEKRWERRGKESTGRVEWIKAKYNHI
jgi:hypothetical protein